jgi:hypothetical protein
MRFSKAFPCNALRLRSLVDCLRTASRELREWCGEDATIPEQIWDSSVASLAADSSELTRGPEEHRRARLQRHLEFAGDHVDDHLAVRAVPEVTAPRESAEASHVHSASSST